MNITHKDIPRETIEAIARSLHKETIYYGFKRIDHIRFVNFFLDLCIDSKNNNDNVIKK